MAINSYAVTPKYLGKLMNTTRKYVNRIGGRSDKLWITEVGWCDKGYKPGHRFCVGTKRQTKYTERRPFADQEEAQRVEAARIRLVLVAGRPAVQRP